MIALYRVPEPANNISSPLDTETLQRLWKITLHNFAPSPTPPGDTHLDGIANTTGYPPEFYEWELVVMNHRPHWDPAAKPSTALPNFVHPQHAIYLIGPNGRNMVPEDIPQHLQELRRHSVHIPTDSLHSAFGHVVWSVLYWDRMMKANA